MKGLLLKDFYILIKQMKLVLLLIMLFALLPQFSYTTFVLVYVSVIPVTLLAYDERSKWNKLALTMPYTRSEIVLSKYVFGILFIGSAALLVFIGNYIYTGVFMDVSELKELLLFSCISIATVSLLLPVVFKFGVEKGRILFILITVFFLALLAFISSDNGALFDKFTLFTEQYPFFIPLFTAVLLALSILTSVSIYIKKDF